VARQVLPIDLPWIPGHEFSGVVDQIGSDVAGYAPRDAVFGATSGMGSYTEYVAVKAAIIARKPSNLSFEEAASVPVASQTAWHGIFTHGHLEKGQTILIHGGAGAVGAYAVQLASHAGANVIATASGDDEAYLKSILRQMVTEMPIAAGQMITKEAVLNWFATHYPKIKERTVAAPLIRLSTNAPSCLHFYAKPGEDDVFFQLDGSHFRLYDQAGRFPCQRMGRFGSRRSTL